MYALHANIWEDSKTNKAVKKQDTKGRHVIISLLQVKYGLYRAYIIREEEFDGISWNSTSDGWISTLNSMVLTAADIATFSSEFFRVGWIRSSQINSRWVTRFMFFWAEDIVDRNLQKRKLTQTLKKKHLPIRPRCGNTTEISGKHSKSFASVLLVWFHLQILKKITRIHGKSIQFPYVMQDKSCCFIVVWKRPRAAEFHQSLDSSLLMGSASSFIISDESTNLNKSKAWLAEVGSLERLHEDAWGQKKGEIHRSISNSANFANHHDFWLRYRKSNL